MKNTKEFAKEYLKEKGISQNDQLIPASKVYSWLMEYSKRTNPTQHLDVIYPFQSKKFMDAVNLWVEYSKEQFNFRYKNISLQGCMFELSELSENNEEIAIKIIYQSIKKKWKNLFKLIDERNNGNGKKSIAISNDDIVATISKRRKSSTVE